MLDIDLAAVYGVSAKRLREQVRRNLDRFPVDFMFELTSEEKAEVAANCGNLEKLKFSRYLPRAFTEHGALMLANVLHSDAAVRASVEVVRAFVRLREMLSTHHDLVKRLDELERNYDAQFKVVFDRIRALMNPPAPRRKRIGFRSEGRAA